MTGTVNTLVSDHPWCRTKWSLMLRGGHLREKNKKLSSNRSDLNVITQNYYLTSKNSGKQTTANNVSNRMALRTVENLYITSFINDSIQFYLWIVLQPFLLVNCYNLRAHLVSAFWNWTFVIFEQWFSYSRTWSCRVIAYEKPVRCDKVGININTKKVYHPALLTVDPFCGFTYWALKCLGNLIDRGSPRCWSLRLVYMYTVSTFGHDSLLLQELFRL